MSWQDFCECICSQLRRHLGNFEGVMASNQEHGFITGRGYSSESGALGLPSNSQGGALSSLSDLMLVTMFVMALFVIFVHSLGRRSSTTDKPRNNRPFNPPAPPSPDQAS